MTQGCTCVQMCLSCCDGCTDIVIILLVVSDLGEENQSFPWGICPKHPPTLNPWPPSELENVQMKMALLITNDALIKSFETTNNICNIQVMNLVHEGRQVWMKGFIIRTWSNLKFTCQNVCNNLVIEATKVIFLH